MLSRGCFRRSDRAPHLSDEGYCTKEADIHQGLPCSQSWEKRYLSGTGDDYSSTLARAAHKHTVAKNGRPMQTKTFYD